MTPFHNMALMCPATTEADVDDHTRAFSNALDSLFPKPPAPGRLAVRW
jgi:glutamate-1-semialdehyde 2,1-aminomutase